MTTNEMKRTGLAVKTRRLTKKCGGEDSTIASLTGGIGTGYPWPAAFYMIWLNVVILMAFALFFLAASVRFLRKGVR